MGILMFVLGIVLSIGIVLFVLKKDRIKKDVALFAIVAMIVSVILELFTFNYVSYENIGQSLKKKEYVMTLNNGALTCNDTKNVSVNSAVNAPIYDIEIKNIDSKVNNIAIFPTEQMGKTSVNISYKDEVFTEYKELSNDSKSIVVPGVKSSEYIRVHLAGKTDALHLSIEPKNQISNAEFRIDINDSIPINFNFFRVMLIAGVLFAIALIYKNRNLEYAGEKSKKVRRIAIATILVFQFLFLSMLSYSQAEQNVFNIFEPAGKSVDSLDQYQELTIALSKGQLYLDHLDAQTEINDDKQLNALKNMKKPFNPQYRDAEVKKYGTTYRWDEAYHDGHYYTYYGPVTVIMTFLPVYLISGKMLTIKIVVLFLTMIVSMLMCLMVHNIAKRRKLNMWVVMGVMAAVLSTTFLKAMFQGAKIYELAPLGAVTLVMIGINLIYEGTHREKRTNLFFGLGSLAVALAIGCKASFLLSSLIVIPVMLAYMAKRGSSAKTNRFLRFIQNVFNKNNTKTLICIAVPYAVVGLLLMAYNAARFGSPFDFGVDYQLTVYNTSYFKITDLSKLPIIIQNGLLKLPHCSMEFPFFNIPTGELKYNGFVWALPGIGLLSYPTMWTIFGIPAMLKNSLKKNKDRVFVAATAITAIIALYVTIVKGGTSYRYSFDYGWMFVILTVFTMFAIYEWARKKNVWKTIAVVFFAAILITVVLDMCLSLSPSHNSAPDMHPKLYYSIYHAVMFWR